MFSASNQGDLGRAIVSILQHPTETANRYLYVQTLATTQNEILTTLEETSGNKWTVKNVQTDGQIKLARELVSRGDFTGMIALVQASGWGSVAGINSNYSMDEELANSMLELPVDDLKSTVKQVLKV